MRRQQPSYDCGRGCRNGTFVGIWRECTQSPPSGATVHAVRAMDWKNVSTWHWSIEPLFTNLKEKSPPPEDPFVYYEAGVFHALFHDRSCTACGGHGYSLDGVAWFYTGAATVLRVRVYGCG